ncbi:MAG: helix-turn-helix domain-containing protein [Candidatus Thorarchaeota archaeon]
MTTESEDVLKALSSSTRRTIMKQISERGSATYTEIMQVLDLDPSLMSGKFNYHLKQLSEVGLIEKTNGGYKVTDLGKRALILVDQVAKEAKIDQYGVLSAVMSMSPTKELELFMSQMGFTLGIMLTILSIVPLIMRYGGGIIFFMSAIAALTGTIVFLASGATMVGIIRKFRVGFSALLFLSSNWFFIRSPNRNNFFIITLFAIGTFVSLTLGILLPYLGVLQLFTLGWTGLITSSIGLMLLTIALAVRARKKAHQLEEMSDEQ